MAWVVPIPQRHFTFITVKYINNLHSQVELNIVLLVAVSSENPDGLVVAYFIIDSPCVQKGPFMGGPLSYIRHMSILRNDNVECPCHLFSPMSHVNSKKRLSHDLTIIFTPLSHVHDICKKRLCRLSILGVNDNSIVEKVNAFTFIF